MVDPKTRNRILWGAGFVVLAFVLLQLGVPLAKYLHSPYAPLLKEVASASYIALIGAVLIASLLMRMGVLPSTPEADAAMTRTKSKLGNLALWVVVAIILVFIFNFMQGPGRAYISKDATDLILSWLPLLLIGGVWIYLLIRARNKKRNDLSGDMNS